MERKIPCEVIRDLLPSYVDGLTSETTDGLIEEHLENCAPCKKVLEAMQTPQSDCLTWRKQRRLTF